MKKVNPKGLQPSTCQRHQKRQMNSISPFLTMLITSVQTYIYTLNKLRELKGLPTIRFRPDYLEAVDVDHLAAGFLLCHNISHGINLQSYNISTIFDCNVYYHFINFSILVKLKKIEISL